MNAIANALATGPSERGTTNKSVLAVYDAVFRNSSWESLSTFFWPLLLQQELRPFLLSKDPLLDVPADSNLFPSTSISSVDFPALVQATRAVFPEILLSEPELSFLLGIRPILEQPVEDSLYIGATLIVLGYALLYVR